jgi:uncharacterized protein (DUF697 family)/tellurite resistance protein
VTIIPGMNDQDRRPILTIALLAAMADGQASPEEQTQLKEAMGRLGVTDADTLAQQARQGQVSLADVARQLSDDAARTYAYELALVVCHADGPVNERETSFLTQLRGALGLGATAVTQLEKDAAALAGSALPVAAAPVASSGGAAPSDAEVDQTILQQAMLTGAVELLPDRLANLVILPLQLRLVYQIGRRYGQQLDANQIKDLAGTLGIGAAAQVVEGVMRKLVRGVAGGLLGSIVGGAGGMATSVAVTFASTYALGHVAQRYYAQGRRLSAADMRELFQKFQQDAQGIFPKVQQEIQSRAQTLNLQSLLEGLRGQTP